MIATVMLYSLIVGSMVAAGAWLLDRLAARAALPRRWSWLGALSLLVGLTLAAPWRMPEPVMHREDLLPALAAAPSSLTATPVAWYAALPGAISDRLAGTIAAVSARVPSLADTVLGYAWALSAAGLLITLMVVLRRLDRQRRGWPRATVHGLQVRVGTPPGPAVYGVLAPDIVVGASLLARSADEQRLVLTHEEEHRLAHDPLLLAATAIGVALIPWHPVAWWCAARLRLATELDCDARVLQRGASTRQYGELLLAVAHRMPAAARVRHSLALLDSHRHLERRLLAMTTAPRRRSPMRLGAFAFTGVALVAAACNTDVPTAAEVRDADVAAVTKSLGLPTAAGAVTYVVDGTRLTESQARAISAEDISVIEVARASGGVGTSEIRIVTRAAAAAALARDELTVERVGGTTERAADEVLVGNATVLRRAEASRLASAQLEPTETQLVLRGDSVFYNEQLVRRRVELRTDGAPGDTVVELALPFMKNDEGNRDVVVVGRSRNASGGSPLIIVDGVISTMPNQLTNIHPEQIANIEVIKGEAARMMYGSRGASGVIRVTTKR